MFRVNPFPEREKHPLENGNVAKMGKRIKSPEWLVQWLRLVLPKGSNRVCASLPSPEYENGCNFLNVVFSRSSCCFFRKLCYFDVTRGKPNKILPMFSDFMVPNILKEPLLILVVNEFPDFQRLRKLVTTYTCWPRGSLYPQKLGLTSLGRYRSLADSGHGV
jgi:hypothetical protein